MIYTVTKEHADKFKDFVPAHILSHIGAPGVYSLGVFDEHTNLRPMGYATFIASCPDQYDGKEIIFINWLFIKEEDRFDGNGTALLDCIKSIAVNSGASEVIIKFAEQDEELKSFLEKRGFELKKGERTGLVCPLGECSGAGVLKGDPDPNVRSFNDILQNDRRLLEILPDSDVSELVDAYINGESFGFDDETGCCYVSEGRIQASLIAANATQGELEVVKLKGFHGFKPEMIIELLQFFRRKALDIYPSETILRVVAEKESSRQLLKKLLPASENEDIWVGSLKC